MMSNMTRIILETADTTRVIGLVVMVIVGIVVLVFALLVLKFARLWLQAYFSRANITAVGTCRDVASEG